MEVFTSLHRMLVGLKKFSKLDDIPEFPRWETQEEFQQLIKEYLEAGAIAKEDLIPGAWYIGQSRSANVAQWFPKTGFEFIRHKFSGSYIDHINHFQDDDGYDLFIPFKLIEIQ